MPEKHPENQILIVEDEEGMALVMRSVLEDAGFQVEDVRTGTEALERIEQEDFALILLDYRLPDMTGGDVLQKLGEKVHTLPIFIVTGYADPKLANDLLGAGADRFIKKEGFDFFDGLVENIREFLYQAPALSSALVWLSMHSPL